MSDLDIDNGDYIVIEGDSEGRAIARVWPGYPEDQGQGIIRIDEDLRQEADVGIDEDVVVEKPDVTPAKSLRVALPKNLRLRGDISPYVHDRLNQKRVTTEQTVRVPFGFGGFGQMSSQRIPVKIAGSDPDGTVVVTDSTNIQVSGSAAEEISGCGGSPIKPTVIESTLNDDGSVEGVVENGSNQEVTTTVRVSFYEDEDAEFYIGQSEEFVTGLKPTKKWRFKVDPPTNSDPKSYEIDLNTD